MVKVIIQMDGEQDKVLSGEFANVMTASDVGDKYKFRAGKEDRRGSALRPGRRSLHSDGNPCFRSERK